MVNKRQKYYPDEKFGYTGIDGASSITGFSKSWLYKATFRCIIPHYKVGGKLIFKIDELQKFVESKRFDVIR